MQSPKSSRETELPQKFTSALRRKTEAALAAAILIFVSPLLVMIAVGILISDPGPIFYIADRAGLRGVVFPMYKFRTMRRETGYASRIAAADDPRVFPFGAILRRLKLDELPQLINIVRGDMAFVGPRPEDPWFVEHHYTAADRETLEVLPGLTSPGTLYYFAHAEEGLGKDDTEAAYVTGPLKIKLQLDRDYIGRASASSDLRIVAETVRVLLSSRP